MTYAQWVQRFVDLAAPFVDSSWDKRFIALLQRIEARLNEVDHGEIPTLFPEGKGWIRKTASKSFSLIIRRPAR